MTDGRNQRREQRELASALRGQGRAWTEIAESLRTRFGINARTAFRLAHGWSQDGAARQWNRRWPDEPKTGKNISYWELWPARTGYAPSLDVLDRLAELYECSVADLVADRGSYHPAGGRRGSSRGSGGQAVSHREAPDGWYVRSLHTLVNLGLDAPEAFEDRTIVATRDGLSEIATAMSVPRHPDDTGGPHGLDVTLLSGGLLEYREQPHESCFRQVISLANPLAAGEEHHYRLLIRVPVGQLMSPHLVHIPLERSDHYRLTVRFSPDRLPSSVWLLAGVPPAVIRDRVPNSATLTLDRYGEVTAEFRQLVQGRAYGVRWRN
jgi:hypothetical protein